MSKIFPLNKQQLEALCERFPTPFYLYDENAIRINAREIQKAFSLFPNFCQHFAVKALPNPAILSILHEEGFGMDCSSLPELLLAEKSGVSGEEIMFTSNNTPSEEFRKAKELGAIINLDDITHIEFLEKSLSKEAGGASPGLPAIIAFRYNPGSLKMGNGIIGNPVEAKYGFTREQIIEGYKLLVSKGLKRFGLHTMVASNELNADYHLETGKLLFEFAVEIKQKCGIELEFVNLGGGVGIPYKPDQKPIDYHYLAQELKKLYDHILVPAGLGNVAIHTEWGRVITGPYGYLVTRAIHKKEIYRNYIGLDASMADLMRPALYGAYHYISVAGKEDDPCTETYDVVGSLCENNDKFALQRQLPKIEVGEKTGDLVIIHDVGAHGRAMGFNYNGKLRCGELLLQKDGTVLQIRRPETIDDYFATLIKTE
ncbi:MAG: diaminopimelate decarboxylase [Spirochaetaceae bacterium]|jgi:diaminopimelate decarboxylase|nr:diaminopimelate decarboxylase [Spirochaetaceae bacterium]